MTPALILTGPTASGKSELALAVAERLGAEILAMDSGTVYRGMEIGTAKPTAADRARVPHHLLDLVEASKGFSVADWLAAAGAAESEILARGRRPLFAGGTPLYLQALLRGLFHAPAQDPELRNRFEQLPDLHASLALVDPATAARLHPNDRKRLVRALEVHALTGRPMSAQLGQWAEAGRPARIVWLDPPRDVLRARIRARAAAMLEGGLVEEAAGLTLSREAGAFIGYAEGREVAAGRMTRPEALERMVSRTWTLVRRQSTWLRKLGGGALRLSGGTFAEQRDQAVAWLESGAEFTEPAAAGDVQG